MSDDAKLAEIRARHDERITAMSIPEPNSGCWIWLGATDGRYGQISVADRLVKAHRRSYECFRGPIPAGLMVCHKCDVPMCVNPDHLFIGTHHENMEDMTQKGRRWNLPSSFGEKNGSAKLRREDVASIRALKGAETQEDIARRFGVTRSAISLIHRGKIWPLAPEAKP